ncbi:MAG: PhoH family protein, partial [Deltaproteobacteria bacterium]
MQTATRATEETKRIVFQDNHTTQVLFGAEGQNLKTIEKHFDVTVNVRGSTVTITGDPADAETVASLLEQLYELVRDGFPLFPSDVDHAVRLMRFDHASSLRQYFLDTVVLSARKKPIVPRTHVQKLYVDAIRKYDIVFGIGPAGTGKTYLAMAMAVASLLKKEVTRIVLTRPAVEAGERLGFLPGDLIEKVNPYLRPLYDALHDMMDFQKANRLVERGVIEVAPLAFMRGRTLNDAFVILDEAQNSTSEQMKMFLTRLGIGSKVVITGDVTQIDLPQGRTSGLLEAREVLQHIPKIRFIEFTRNDVVRHQL